MTLEDFGNTWPALRSKVEYMTGVIPFKDRPKGGLFIALDPGDRALF